MSTPKKSKRFRFKAQHMRRIVQAAFVAIVAYVGIQHIVIGGGPTGAPSFDAFCPFGGIESLWAVLTTGSMLQKTNWSNLVILLATLATALVAGRFFCGWICPFGTVQEWSGRILSLLTGKRLPLAMPEAIDRPLRYMKFVVLAAIILATVWAGSLIFAEVCPYRVLFSGEVTTLGLIVLGAVAVGSLVFERFWCKYLCPLGAVLAVFNKITPFKVTCDTAACLTCDKCARTCPMSITDRPERIDSIECIRCLECVESCPKEGVLDMELRLLG
ncbi:MAG: 4Fe-4S binding protein [Chloroflexi bacterium]|nr:4Fe-4S binding protein [Chloroflexota bacterium]